MNHWILKKKDLFFLKAAALFILIVTNIHSRKSCREKCRVKAGVKDDFQSVLRSLRTLMFINIINGAHSMECESMLFVENHIPYL